MAKKKQKEFEVPVNIFDFNTLTNLTIKNSAKLKEYFRLNLIYYQLISGKGLEFDRIKEYVPGDDTRRMDWKIYARTNQLHVRHYKEERKFDIIIVMDVSNSMLLGTNEYTKNEFASLIAGTLSFAATEAGDNVGGGMFSDKVDVLIDPEPDFYNLLQVISNKENYGGKKDWKKFTNRMLMMYPSDAIIFLISDFINTDVYQFLPEMATSFAKVYGIMVRDPVDNQLPRGVGKVYLKDPNTGEVVVTDLDVLREEYELMNKKEIEKIKDLFHSYDQLFFNLETGTDFATGFVKAMGDEEVIIS